MAAVSAKKSGDVVLRGELRKRGEINKSFKERYFVLTSQYLYYYKTQKQWESNKNAQGFVELKSVTDITECDSSGLFHIRTSFGRTFIVTATSEEEGRAWVDAIRRAQLMPSKLASVLSRARAVSHDEDTARKATEIIDLILSRGHDELLDAERQVERLEADVARKKVAAARSHSGSSADEGAGSGGGASTGDTVRAGSTPADPPAPPSAASGAGAGSAGAGGGGVTKAASGEDARTNGAAGAGAGSDGSSAAAGAGAARASSISGGMGIAEGISDPSMSAIPLTKSASGPEAGTFREQYKIGREIGRGSYSTVYFGLHKTTNLVVAVKVVPKDRIKEKEEKALRSEVNVLMQLKHDNIVQLIDFFEEEAAFFLVMEFVAAGDLFDQILKMHHYSQRDARRIVRTLLQTIKYCHDHGIVHRDLKPENILVTSEDPATATIKIADWGFSTVVDPEGLTTSCGSPSYVAPEVLKGGPYGVHVDLWSLGVIAYALLCGYLPFSHHVQNKLFQRICAGEFEFDSPYWDDISPAATDFIRKLLVVDPDKRLTAEEALRHPWFAGSEVSDLQLSSVFTHMQAFMSTRTRALMEGYLSKKGHVVPTWKRRFFVLTPEELLYYDEESAPTGESDMGGVPLRAMPRGTIPLDDIRSTTTGDASTAGYEITILTYSGKDYLLRLSSETESKEWLRGIMSAQQRLELMSKAKLAAEIQRRGTEATDLLALADDLSSALGFESERTFSTASGGPSAAAAALSS